MRTLENGQWQCYAHSIAMPLLLHLYIYVVFFHRCVEWLYLSMWQVKRNRVYIYVSTFFAHHSTISSLLDLIWCVVSKNNRIREKKPFSLTIDKSINEGFIVVGLRFLTVLAQISNWICVYAFEWMISIEKPKRASGYSITFESVQFAEYHIN